MAHRSSGPERAERWDRGRYEYERDRDRYGDIRERFEESDDHVYVRRGGSSSRPPPPRDDRSEAAPSDVRSERRFRTYNDEDDDVVVRERRRVVYDDEEREPRFIRRRMPSPPPASEVERSRVEIEERVRYRTPSPSPVRRPTRLIRRQSSLDTFDRKPARRYWEKEREEYGPPARRDDYRVPPYVDIPLPRSKALPPPRERVVSEREYRDEIQVSDPHRYGDDDFREAYPERVREKEIIRTRRRTRSRESRVRSRSSSTSSSSSSGGTTLTARSEYPKKGKTRIPARLVSKRALIDLGYPFVEEGNIIIVQKALGQQNIDDLLKLSDEYKNSELEVIAARSSAGDIIEERVETRREVWEGPAALPGPPPAPAAPAGTGPVIIQANPPPQQPVEVVKTTVIRDVSPARTYTTASYDTASSYDTTTSYDTYTTSTTATPVVYRRDIEESAAMPVGPVALATAHHRRGSLETDELRSQISHLERQLARRDRSRHHRHGSRSRHRSVSRGGELIRAERLSTGELVLYEEEVERVREPSRGGVRIEKDKRGRLSISVPSRHR
ncbi:uncharacterized protein B0T15DRAFT_266012 [Chaetomium strumarium]|uniref:DUF8035 domain-containing protein n=1 Tax=Chaetomium strumarium TaxID=1170767 RepID=A0AAJ0LZA1_9PEZI|nr:hypothetical protein B0T15DRAFT_266012 [Chaetomium strumarium]